MTDQPPQTQEHIRLARLGSYRILDTSPDTTFDRIARIAAMTMGTPMAAIGFMDSSRVWFKARVGFLATAVPRVGAFCENLLHASGPLVITDTHADPRFDQAFLVRQPPAVRFYVGVPLCTPDGVHIGSLCAMDTQPREYPTDHQIGALVELATMAVEETELRSSRGNPATVSSGGPGVPAEGAHRNLLAAYAAKSEFLSSLSHELRTPLNAIVGYAGLIAGSDDTPPATADHAGEITAAARHMLALVNDILEYSRLEAGNLSLGWQRVMVGPIVEAALHMVAVFATSRGIHLLRDLSWADAAVRGDPVRLKQVLLNLLTNAIKFTPRGGQVLVRLTPAPDGQVRLEVSDTGIGIAEADIPKTLTPFGQIVPKEGAQTEGTGLGLPIAKSLIERHGGTMQVSSEIGRGTIVRIDLPPLHPARPAQGAARPAVVG